MQWLQEDCPVHMPLQRPHIGNQALSESSAQTCGAVNCVGAHRAGTESRKHKNNSAYCHPHCIPMPSWVTGIEIAVLHRPASQACAPKLSAHIWSTDKPTFVKVSFKYLRYWYRDIIQRQLLTADTLKSSFQKICFLSCDKPHDKAHHSVKEVGKVFSSVGKRGSGLHSLFVCFPAWTTGLQNDTEPNSYKHNWELFCWAQC